MRSRSRPRPDALFYRYRADDADDGNYGPWLAALRARIPAGAGRADLGCGNGIPVARHLAAAGHTVTGVDSSQVQIQRARRLVPASTFLHADITSLTLPAAAFDAVVCLYALIHVPLEEQPPLLGRIAGWLRPGGWLLATTSHQAWTGVEDGWLGGSVPMWSLNRSACWGTASPGGGLVGPGAEHVDRAARPSPLTSTRAGRLAGRVGRPVGRSARRQVTRLGNSAGPCAG